MRRPWRVGGALFLAGAVLASGACSSPTEAGPDAESETAPSDPEGAPDLEELIAQMSLEEKVGQLFVAYLYGETAETTDPASVAANQEAYGVDNGAELVEEYHLGGVVYFDWAGNTGDGDPEGVSALSNGLQEAALRSPSAVPLLIAIDQEGGPVSRLGEPVTQFPEAERLGSGGETDDAQRAAEIGGRELRAMGINQNYAPVADVNVNPDNPVINVRSFGAEPALVAEMTAAQVQGYQSEGVAATAKHFPGHGNTDVDSHTGVPVVTHTVEEWEEIDAPPFEAAIEAGADAVLTGHLVFPELDPSGTPATLSEPIITGLLREEMGYEGVVVTDALDMEGVRESYDDEEVPVLALQAGVDQLLQSPPGTFEEQYHAVLEAVEEGELTEERIEESVHRVLTLKSERGLFEDPFADESQAAEIVGDEEHERWAERLAQEAPTD